MEEVPSLEMIKEAILYVEPGADEEVVAEYAMQIRKEMCIWFYAQKGTNLPEWMDPMPELKEVSN